MSAVDTQRWTCPAPGCGVTTVIYGQPDDVACCLVAVQTRHGNKHRATEAARTRKFVRAIEQAERKRRSA